MVSQNKLLAIPALPLSPELFQPTSGRNGGLEMHISVSISVTGDGSTLLIFTDREEAKGLPELHVSAFGIGP